MRMGGVCGTSCCPVGTGPPASASAFRYHEVLGSGASGTVHRVEYCGRFYALKKFLDTSSRSQRDVELQANLLLKQRLEDGSSDIFFPIPPFPVLIGVPSDRKLMSSLLFDLCGNLAHCVSSRRAQVPRKPFKVCCVPENNVSLCFCPCF